MPIPSKNAQEARQRQEKREQAKAERVEAAEEGGEGAVTAVAQRDTREEASGGGKAKKSLGCNTCGLTFPDTVRALMYPVGIFFLRQGCAYNILQLSPRKRFLFLW